MLFPFIWLLMTSIKPEAEIVTYPPKLWPTRITFKAYVDIWKAIPFARFFVNTVVFACGVTIISLLFDSFSAYAFARLSFPGRDILFLVILITLMIPFQVTMVPLFALLHKLGWLNTYAALIIPRASNAFGIFLLRQFFKGIPIELEDSALLMERQRGIYWKIIMPLSKPALATLTIFRLCITGTTFSGL